MDTQIDKYRIEQELGRGGMSVVYKATAQGPAGFQKTFAVKVLKPDKTRENETVTMFMDEARLGAHLVHPNIVPVLDFGKTDGGYFIAMEYVSGASLSGIMKRRFAKKRGFSRDEVLFTAAEVLKALDYAHNFKDQTGKKTPVIHRDVSPENVLISESGTVKLCDFGIAKGDFRTEKTRTGVVKGKVAYIAPEVMEKGRVGPGSDIFALGVMLFEMVSGKRVGAERVQFDEALEELNCQADMMELLRHALASDPSRRFKSAAQMLDEVTDMGFDPIKAARELSKGLRPRKKRKKAAGKSTETRVSMTKMSKQEIPDTAKKRDPWFTVKVLIAMIFLFFAAAILLAVFHVKLLK